MRDRNLAPTAVVGAIVCCGAMALSVAVVGGFALAAVGRFTAVSIAARGAILAMAWTVDRRRQCHDCRGTTDRSAYREGTLR